MALTAAQRRQYAWQPLVDADWSRGIVRDLPISSIPPGGLYDAVDFLVDQPGVLYKRGGTSYQSNAIGATTTGVNFVAAPEYPTGTKIVALGADGHLYDATTGTASDRGAFSITTLDIPKLYVDKLIVPNQDGANAVKKVYVSAGNVTFGDLGGSPPTGRLVATHISRIVLANTLTNPNRAWFSPVPDVEATWDTSNAYVDFNHSLSAVASVQGVLLGFSATATERLVGDIPPGTTGENMRLQPLGQVGCADARSVAPWGSYVVFASQEGVYVTNGAGFDSLTEKADGSGIQSYWRALYASTAASSGFIAGGILAHNYYIVTLGLSNGVILATLLCYLPRKAWTSVSNIGCIMYAPARASTFSPNTQGPDELYGATMNGKPGNRLLALSSILLPSNATSTDANGSAVTPQAQFRMSGEGVGLKAYGDGHLTYSMPDTVGGANPTLAVQVASGLGATSFDAVAESPVAETSAVTRKRFTVGKDAQSVRVKLAQTGASSKTEVYLLEMEQRAYDFASEVA